MRLHPHSTEVMPGRDPPVMNVDSEKRSTEPSPDIGTSRKRARWSHEIKLFLVGLLKDYDVPGYRTQNAWSKEAWTNIVSRLNAKFGTSYSLSQVKQKEQDLKKDYRIVQELKEESGFGWHSERNMVTAPPSVWDGFAARKNNTDYLSWQDKAFPYFDDLHALYDGRYAEGRTRHGMDHYAKKSKNASGPSTQQANATDAYQSPSPTQAAQFESGLQFHFDEDFDDRNVDSSTPVQHMQIPPRSSLTPLQAPEPGRGKKHKAKSGSPDEGFHEKYLKLKREEMDRFAAIEEKKLEDPYSINKCITMLGGLNGIQMGDILMASDIFKSKDNRELFLSFTSDALRLAWIKREIGRLEAQHQN